MLLPEEPVEGSPVSAAWGRRVVRFLKSLRLVSSPDFLVSHNPNGTTLSLRKIDNDRPPRIWDVPIADLELDPISIISKILEEALGEWQNAIPSESDFDLVLGPVFAAMTRTSLAPGTIAAQIEELFDDLELVVNGLQQKIDEILDNIIPISDALTSFFENLETYPRDGDYIYNDTLGICYTVFEKKEARTPGTANPSGNLIFRVEFPVVIGEAPSKTFCAITLFPAPDISKFIRMLFEYLLGFVKKILGSSISSLVNSIFSGIISGLDALYNELLGLIDAIPGFDPSYLEDLIQGLQDALDALKNRVDLLEQALDALQQALDALQATIDGSVNVTVIGADGNYHTLKVQEDTAGTSAEREITWINSTKGYGQRSKFLVKQGALAPTDNIEDVDWRQVNYIHPDGTTYQMHCLVRVADLKTQFPGYLGPEPYDSAGQDNNFTLKEIILCEDGAPVNYRGIFKKEHGALPAENSAQADFWTPPTP